MNLIFKLIILCLFFWIFISKGDRKLIPLVFTLLCVESSLIFIPSVAFLHGGRMAVFNALIFCSLFRYEEMKKYWNGFPFKWQLLLMLVSSFIIAFFSKYISDLQHRISQPLFEFMDSYLLFFIAYVYSRRNSFCSLKNTLVICTIILTIIGIINGILRFNPYIALIEADNIFDFAHMYTHRERFRISSLFSNPFDYGYTCLILNMITIYLKQMKIIGKWQFSILFLGSFWGILFCNCRTVVIVYVIGISIYYLVAVSLKRHMAYFLLFIIFYSITYISIPIVEHKTNQIVSAFTNFKGEDVKGSSLNLRTIQLTGSFLFFQKSPIVGNGYNYIRDKLGWGKQKISKQNRKMAGYESVIFKLLIERGIIGIVAYLLFYGSILFYLIKNYEYDIYLGALGIAILSMYMFFAIATGELSSVPITLVCLGI